MSQSFGCTSGQLVSIASNCVVDGTSVSEQEVNGEKVSWYMERINQCKEDDCMEAANAYLRKCLKDSSLNDITRSYIICETNKGVF